MFLLNHTPRILAEIEKHQNAGAEIVQNGNWRYTGQRAGYQRVVRISQTNYGRHACVVTWACYR